MKKMTTAKTATTKSTDSKSNISTSSSGNNQSSRQTQQVSNERPQDADALLKADHRKVEALFEEFESATSDADKASIARKICRELITHTLLEETIFYPACRDGNVESDLLDEAQVEHDGAKALIRELMLLPPDSAFYDAKVKVLSEYIKHHVGEEEKSDGIFAKAREADLDMSALGQRIQARKQDIMAKAEAQRLGPPKPVSLFTQAPHQHDEEEAQMNRQYDRDRDEQGRFMSDDDYRGSRRSQSRGGSQYRERDDQGRFMSDDNGNGSRSSRGRYEDDDDRSYSSRGRGQGGWFGDSEGHSRAAQRGWDDRGSSRSSRYEDDDDGRRSRYGYDERQSTRSRYEDDDDRRSSSRDRGQGGWFGDSEGHSEAARRGWDERGSSSRSRGRDDDDDRRMSQRGGSSRSRSRDDDDDDRRSSRGHGGWFGDPRGHAEAARRGWENRE